MTQNHIRVRQGEAIFKEGDQGDSMYVIVEGQVQIVRNSSGRPVVLATLRTGDFFGEMAIVQRSPRSATAVAVSDVVLMVVKAAHLELLLKQRPDLGAKMIYTLTRRLKDTTNRVMDEKEKTALLFGSASDPQLAPRNHPATPIGVIKQALQRAWLEIRGP